MTRKHFQAIADALKTADVTPAARRELARDLASVCKSVNPNFDRARFMDAAGVEN